MDIGWLLRNVTSCWLHRASMGDALRRLCWIYAGKLPGQLRPREWVIGFRYREPLGKLRFLVRANGGSDAFIFGEVFDHEYYQLPMSPPETILDLGANAGFTAVYFARVYPGARLACVEPVPGNVRTLTRNLELNGVTADVFAAAVAAQDGYVMMELVEKDYGHKIADAPVSAAGRFIEVPALTVSTILKQLEWGRIGLLKVDIEGYEKVLFSTECDWLQCVDALCIECHEGFGEVDLRKLAEQFGFLPPSRLPGVWLMTRRDVSRI